MRLLTLDLERFGPFTDRTVAFRSDARLHVVLGPNEAGKSCALAAVTDLLFGIGPRTSYAFLHDMPKLRIGADIAALDGRRLAFRRRKGNANTLVDAADAPMPADALAPFLQGMTREVFTRAFGLDAASLREGGKEMLRSDGEVGASLFAAASGLRGYRALHASLQDEADAIFAPRAAQHRTFYQARERYEDARKAIRATELREGPWRELNEQIADASSRLDGIRRERERIAAARGRLERLQRVGPLISGIDDAIARAQADTGLLDVEDAAIDRLGALLDRLRTAATEHARDAAAFAAAVAERDAAPGSSGLIDRAEEILERARGVDLFDIAGRDLVRVQSEADRLSEDLSRLAVRIGLPDIAALVERQPTDAARARVESLIREGQTLAASRERIDRELSEARAEHDALAREQAEGGAPVDPAPLREALKPFASLRGAIAERQAVDATIERGARVLRAQAARLSPPVGDPASLAAAPLPSAATVARFRSLFEEADRARALARQRLDAAETVLSATRERLREREAGRPITSWAEVQSSREERDRRFATLRSPMMNGAGVPAAEIAAYERAVHDADGLADQLAADAARVAEQAADLKRFEAQERDAAAAEAALVTVEVEIAEVLAAWAETWRPAAIQPHPPAEMAAWLAEAESLIESLDVLDERRVDQTLLAKRIESARAPLAAFGRRVGLDDLDGLEVSSILDRVEARLAALGQRWDATRETGARIRAAASGIARHEADRAVVGERRTAWRTAWSLALPGIGLPAEAGIEEAASALAAWREVPPAMRERDGAERRVAGMRRDREAYRAGVSRFAELAPDLDLSSPSAAVRTLHKRLEAAQSEAARRAELIKRCEEAGRHAGMASRRLDEARTALSGHLDGLGIADPASALPEIEAMHARLITRRSHRTALAARREELSRVADGISEAALRAELVETSADAIGADLARLSAEQDENDHRGQVAFAERDASERRRAELEAGTGAELAAAQKKAAEAEIGAQARHWAVLRLAQLMLGSAIERHRNTRQEPLLARAGALFSTLTGTAFVGLVQDYGDGDEPRIVGRRASGETVQVEHLSEGTRDQLYLALRLAYLQDYAERAEPAPFLGDDLFMSFDNARTAQGLDVLAAIGDRIQPILFTHHRHVADLAQARLGQDVDIVRL